MTSRSTMNEQSIVNAAMIVIRRGGVDALTMRAVAEEHGVSAMALYYYVPAKEVLLDRVRAAVLMQVPTPTPRGEDWEAQMKAYALAGIELLSSYPGLLRFGVTRPPTHGDVHLTRYGISILLAAGFDEHAAALAVTTYHICIIGSLMMLPRRRSRGRPRPGSKPRVRARGVDGVLEQLRALDSTEAIEYGIETVLSGLRLRLAATAASRGPQLVSANSSRRDEPAKKSERVRVL